MGFTMRLLCAALLASCCAQKMYTGSGRLDNCVAGDAASCKGQWTGDMCCFEGDWLCFSGASVNSSTCSGSWTGSECCMQGDYNCTAGDEATCTGVWTGSSCCLEKVARRLALQSTSEVFV